MATNDNNVIHPMAVALAEWVSATYGLVEAVIEYGTDPEPVKTMALDLALGLAADAGVSGDFMGALRVVLPEAVA
ncbi:MAG: hypothetical protein QM597_06835 [Aeromicrobium sp.]|uniref:hypothetical protein n=1 Tax=Aeromicrobium sp. TaxID=1871063 RepID=UPI0039E53ABC